MKTGFFNNIKEVRNILCPTVPVECKNYAKDPQTPESAQLSDRLSPRRGKFGILVCRQISNRKKTIEHCKDRLHDKEEYIIVLDDKDMEKLANLKEEEGNEAVDDYMEDKLDEIID